MGNILTKLRKKRMIDGGYLYPPEHEQPNTYRKEVTKKLILQRKLAPFYVPVDDNLLSERKKKKRKVALKEVVECPICMSQYPKHINRTVCCKQSICTNCFVHLRRPPSGRSISCPFCNAAGLAIIYESPISQAMNHVGSNSVHHEQERPARTSSFYYVRSDRRYNNNVYYSDSNNNIQHNPYRPPPMRNNPLNNPYYYYSYSII